LGISKTLTDYARKSPILVMLLQYTKKSDQRKHHLRAGKLYLAFSRELKYNYKAVNCRKIKGIEYLRNRRKTMGIEMILMIVVMIAIFYFFMIRPENKKKKKLAEMRNSLSVGDSITTIGGIFGKVVSIADEKITFETSEDRVRIQIAKWAVSTVGKATEEPPK